MAAKEININLYQNLTRTVRYNDRMILIWDQAFTQALMENDIVHIPDSDEPYYISRTIILSSGKSLRLGKSAEIRAVPGMITAMLRNKTILPGNQYAEPKHIPHDQNISVSGGIWNASREDNPNYNGSYDLNRPVTGMCGTFVFSNVKDLKISELEIRNTRCFCIQLSNAENIEVAGLTFRNGGSDGLHMNGPLKNVHAHDLINEGTGDDFVAFNAWDWGHSHITAGTIEDVTVENCICRSAYNCIRLLPGEKCYFDGTTRECAVKNVTLRNIHNVQNFKMYAQGPSGAQENLKVGKMENIHICDIYGLKKMNTIPFDPPYYGQKDRSAPFEILADITGLTLKNLHGDFDFPEKPVIVAIGPLAFTAGVKDGDDPFFAKEVFPSHLSCEVKELSIGPVFDQSGNAAPEPEKLVCAFQLSPRPDYTPGRDITRGGTGRGIVSFLKK